MKRAIQVATVSTRQTKVFAMACSSVPPVALVVTNTPKLTIADHMPPTVRRGMLGGEMDIDDDNAATYARSAEALLQMIARLHRAGVPGRERPPRQLGDEKAVVD